MDSIGRGCVAAWVAGAVLTGACSGSDDIAGGAAGSGAAGGMGGRSGRDASLSGAPNGGDGAAGFGGIVGQGGNIVGSGGGPSGFDASAGGGSAGAGDSGVQDGSRTPTGPYDDIYRGGFCSEDWCWSNPLPQGNNIRTMWSPPGGEAWAGADGSTVLRWSADHWERLATTGRFQPAIWGSGPDDVYIAASYDLWHFDGQKLEKLPLPAGFDSAVFNDISGTSKTDVWAARDDGVAHFGGVSWSMVSAIPKLDNGYAYVTAAAPNEIWFVANQSTFGLYLWNKVQWQTVLPDVSTPIWAAAPGDIYYYSTLNGTFQGNASGWSPVGHGGSQYLKEIFFGTGPKDVYALNDTPDVSHFDGTTWTDGIAKTNTSVDGGEARTGTAATPGEAWLGGSGGRLWRLQGTTLTATVPASSVPPLNEFKAVWSDGQKVYALGFGIFELDASGATDTWTRVPGTESMSYFNGLWGASSSEIWLVGDYDHIARFDGTTVTPVTHGDAAVSASDLDWIAIAAASAKNVWAVGTWGYAAHYDGISWTESRSGIQTPKNIWVDPNGEVWACGEAGVVTHYVPGAGWTNFPEIENANVTWNSIAGTSGTDVWVASSESYLRHYDGKTWKEFSIPDRYNYITQLRALAPNDVWGVGEFGTSIHWNGTTLREVYVKYWDRLSGLWMDKSGEGWAVGTNGTILHHRAPH